MKILFDACTAPVLASTINGYVTHYGHKAIHMRDTPWGRHAKDLEWIPLIAPEAKDWLVVTGDERITRNKAELRALQSARLGVRVLAPAYQKTPQHQIASILIWRWPEIQRTVGAFERPFAFQVGISRTGRLRQL